MIRERADGRPRIHIATAPQVASWALGPSGTRSPAPDAGAALNSALEQLGDRAAAGAVVIIEPT